MRIIVVESYEEMSIKAASIVKSQLVLKPDCVLGCATGETPLGMYQELVKAYRNKEADFAEATFFNLDEYCNMDEENPQSYPYYMEENFFNHINANKNNIFVPDGMAKDMDNECLLYDKKIRDSGGIDLQILGIGKNGHIGFNEPDISLNTETHLVNLTTKTIRANSRFFNTAQEVPKKAITMGIGTIMRSRKIILLANGKRKAWVIERTINGPITTKVPATILQLHNDVTIIIDQEAVS